MAESIKDKVAVGTRVTVQEEDNDPEIFYMVGVKEADPRNGRISHESPIGFGNKHVFRNLEIKHTHAYEIGPVCKSIFEASLGWMAPAASTLKAIHGFSTSCMNAAVF
jgi:hypothetical protein